MIPIRYMMIGGLLLGEVFLLSDCGRDSHSPDDGHDHASSLTETTKEASFYNEHEGGGKHSAGDGHDHGVEASGATFEEGKGIRLKPKTAKVLGLKTQPVVERRVRHAIESSGQVFRAADESTLSSGRYQKGFAYVNALIVSDVANYLKIGQSVTLIRAGDVIEKWTGKLIQLEWALEPVTGQVEFILEVPDPKKTLHVGSFLTIKAVREAGKTSETVVAVPDTAVIRAASGTFVYVANGEFFLRTEVKTGQRGEGFTEIVDGLYEGDIVVVEPASKLWLIELRAVKGGGHSH